MAERRQIRAGGSLVPQSSSCQFEKSTVAMETQFHESLCFIFFVWRRKAAVLERRLARGARDSLESKPSDLFSIRWEKRPSFSLGPRRELYWQQAEQRTDNRDTSSGKATHGSSWDLMLVWCSDDSRIDGLKMISSGFRLAHQEK